MSNRSVCCNLLDRVTNFSVYSSLHAQITSDDPLFALEDFSAFMKHAVCAVLVQKGKPNLESYNEWL